MTRVFAFQQQAAGKDAGFTTYAAASYRQYERLTKSMKPDLKAYKKSQDEWGEDSTDAGSLAYGHHDRVSSQGMEAMVVREHANHARPRAHTHTHTHTNTHPHGILTRKRAPG